MLQQKTLILHQYSNDMKKLGNIYPSNGQAGWIYSINGISPTMVTMDKGAGKETKIVIRNKSK